MHFVENESFNAQIRASSIIWLGMDQTLAQGPIQSRPGQSIDSTESLAAISDVDAEKTVEKSFDKTTIKKG